MKSKASSLVVDAQEAAREKCLRLLARRARSAAELRQRLSGVGFEREVIARVLADLDAAGLVDDAEFARAWVASRRAAGGAGREKLRWELRRKGIAEDLIAPAVEEGTSDEMEIAQALALARRRLREEPLDRKSLARLRRLLLGRGFGFDTVDTVMRRIISEGKD
jgi:regulatory protein